jgi:hypothetical protein
MLQPNYNLNHKELYTNATLAWIRSSRSLDILSYVDRCTFPSSGLPSYVPDFKADLTHCLNESVLLTRLKALTLFDASEGFVERTTALPSLQVLTKAIFVDTVLQGRDFSTMDKWTSRYLLYETRVTPQQLHNARPRISGHPFRPLVYI